MNDFKSFGIKPQTKSFEAIGAYMGGVLIEVIINDFVCIQKEFKQCIFPKTKKVRIRRKWAKRTKNYKMVDVHRVYIVGRRMVVSSKYYEKLKQMK